MRPPDLLLAALLVASCLLPAIAAGPPPLAAAPACGSRPDPMPLFAPSSTSCWDRVAAAPGSLQFSGVKDSQADEDGASVASWAQLQARLDEEDGPIALRLSGRLQAGSPLRISGMRGVQLVGPATIECSGSGDGSTAIVVQGSSGVVLRDLEVTGCPAGAVIINATSASTAAAAKPLAAPTGGVPAPPPDVQLIRVNITACGGGRGAGVAATRSRVALRECRLADNVAQGCGAGVFAAQSALLVVDSTFERNVGNNTDGDDVCRGGALHAERSWVAVAGSTFSGNQGVNGSALLLVEPVGVAQVHNCTFEDNRPRPGVDEEFAASAGAVAVLGTAAGGASEGDEPPPEVYPSKLERAAEGDPAPRCRPPPQGLAIVGCRFSNCTAALAGGTGGLLSAYRAFLAVVDSELVGTPPPAGGTGSAQRRMGSYVGGCIYAGRSDLLVSGSRLSHCNGRFVGGAIRASRVTAVVRRSTLEHSYADMGGGIIATDCSLLLEGSSLVGCEALSVGGGMYLESNELVDLHMDNTTLERCSCTGKGGAVYGETLEEDGVLRMSVHRSRVVDNQGLYGAGFNLLSVTQGELVDTLIAHNHAPQIGGGLYCSRVYGDGGSLASVGTTWLNNTAGIMGGAVALEPCNLTMHGDRVLANAAGQEGGALAVNGGERVVLHGTRVVCNQARLGAGVSAKLSDESMSHVRLVCSNVTANGGGSGGEQEQRRCLAGALGAAADTLLLGAPPPGAAPAGAPQRLGPAPAATKGGGVFVAQDQRVTLASGRVEGNMASSSGAGIYLDRGARLSMAGAGGAVSGNNCTGGSGGGLFMEEGSALEAADAAWSGNQGMFGGAVFAMGNSTSMTLSRTLMEGNLAAAGGAVATLGGARIRCNGSCEFRGNRAKVGGALMLHGGSFELRGATLVRNVASAGGGGAAGAADTPTAAAAAAETIQYMLGDVQVAAGGGLYAWHMGLTLRGCNLTGNVAHGPAGRGGGAFVDESTLRLVDSTAAQNWASAAGGAVLLGPAGARQALEVSGGQLEGNAAGHFGGAVAAGALLPGDTAAAAEAAAEAGSAGAGAQWSLRISGSALRGNAAGRQGGAIACSLCDSVALGGSELKGNSVGQTGGAVSCVGCGLVELRSCMLASNKASSGGGASLLAAGEGSGVHNCTFAGNTADTTAAASAASIVSERRQAAARTAGDAASAATAAAVPLLPSAEQALPSCSVEGVGGGLCLGLWRAGFELDGPNGFTNNSASFGAGLFVEACEEGPGICPMRIDLGATRFAGNAAPGVGMPKQSPAGRQGSGVDLYVTNATVLLLAAKPGAVPTPVRDARGASPSAAPAAPAAVMPPSGGETAPAGAPAGARRRLLQLADASAGPAGAPPPAADGPLAAAQELAAAGGSGGGGGGGVATGPALLGLRLAGGTASGRGAAASAGAAAAAAEVTADGRLRPVLLPVLDQLGQSVAPEVAQQLSVQASANFGNCTTCALAGMSKVMPVNSTATFEQLQLLAEPGSEQVVEFWLLSALEGAELPNSRRSVRVSLPSCYWGQATTPVGCFNCSSPLFTFSYYTPKCSVCPRHVAACSTTTLLPGNGTWNSDILSTRMHKCLDRRACIRGPKAEEALKCLQQRQLELNNPGAAATAAEAAHGRPRGSNPWDDLRAACAPVLASLEAAGTAAAGPGAQPVALNSTDAIAAVRSDLMCAQGYTGKLCSNCQFPETATTPAYGRFAVGCAVCPPRRTALTMYVLARAFDLLVVGVLILTMLLEMRKRRHEAAEARRQQAVLMTPHASTATIGAHGSSEGGGGGKGAPHAERCVPAGQTVWGAMSRRGPPRETAPLTGGPTAAPISGSWGPPPAPLPPPLPAAPPQPPAQDAVAVVPAATAAAAPVASPEAPAAPPPRAPVVSVVGGDGDVLPGAHEADAPHAQWLTQQLATAASLQLHDDPLPPVGNQEAAAAAAAATAAAAAAAAMKPAAGRKPPQQQPQQPPPPSLQQQQQQQQQHLAQQQQLLQQQQQLQQQQLQQQQLQQQQLQQQQLQQQQLRQQQLQQQQLQQQQQHLHQHPQQRLTRQQLAALEAQGVAGTTGAQPAGLSSGAHPSTHRSAVSTVGPLLGPLSGPAAERLWLQQQQQQQQQQGPGSLKRSIKHSRRDLKRAPLFARERTTRKLTDGTRAPAAPSYAPSKLTNAELFEVLKDFLQVLSILQVTLLGWHTAVAAALSAVSFTPVSTKAWVSLDCVLPRTEEVAALMDYLNLAAQLLQPVGYALLLVALWAAYAALHAASRREPPWSLRAWRHVRAPTVASLLVLLSYFYPSLAYGILGVFSCRRLDPDGSSIPGEVLSSPGWYWAASPDVHCFADPTHRLLVLALGVPGALALLAYPLLQAALLARQAARGKLQPTSEFFANYGYLVESFRPRLFYWASVVELRKLVLVATVLGLASTGVVSQLVGCGLVLLGFAGLSMAVLPYPYRALNRLHLASSGVLLAVVWLSLFVAVSEDGGGVLPGGDMSDSTSLALQLMSLVLVAAMVALLLSVIAVRLYRQAHAFLDADGDGRVSAADCAAVRARLAGVLAQRVGSARAAAAQLVEQRRSRAAARQHGRQQQQQQRQQQQRQQQQRQQQQRQQLQRQQLQRQQQQRQQQH